MCDIYEGVMCSTKTHAWFFPVDPNDSCLMLQSGTILIVLSIEKHDSLDMKTTYLVNGSIMSTYTARNKNSWMEEIA